MWTLVQILIDVVFAASLIVLAAAHISGRTTSAELDVIRKTFGHEIDVLRAKIDGGAIPTKSSKE